MATTAMIVLMQLDVVLGNAGTPGLPMQDTPENREKNIADDLGLDSLEVVELTILVEQELDIEIQDEEVENLSTVGDMIALAERKVNARNQG